MAGAGGGLKKNRLAATRTTSTCTSPRRPPPARGWSGSGSWTAPTSTPPVWVAWVLRNGAVAQFFHTKRRRYCGVGWGGAEDYARQNYLPMARSLPPVSHASSMVIFLRCVMSNPVQVKNVPHYLNPCPTLSKVHSTPRGLYKNGISRSSVRIMFWGKHVFEGCSPWAFPLLFRSITITITMLGFLCAMLNFSAYM